MKNSAWKLQLHFILQPKRERFGIIRSTLLKIKLVKVLKPLAYKEKRNILQYSKYCHFQPPSFTRNWKRKGAFLDVCFYFMSYISRKDRFFINGPMKLSEVYFNKCFSKVDRFENLLFSLWKGTKKVCFTLDSLLSIWQGISWLSHYPSVLESIQLPLKPICRYHHFEISRRELTDQEPWGNPP